MKVHFRLRQNNVVSVHACRVREYLPEQGMVHASLGEQMLSVIAESAPETDIIKLAIRAKDVLISLLRPQQTSARNIFAGTITKIQPCGKYTVIVHVDCGEVVSAAISQQALQELELTEGMAVFLLIKAVSLVI